MQTAVAEMPAAPPRAPRSANDLLSLSAPLLELVLKIQAGVVEPSHDIRPLADDLLRQLEEGALQLGYHPRQIEHVKFALVAFLDETVLSPQRDFPLRGEWERSPLQLVYFKVHLAGEEFFDRLELALAAAEAGGGDVAEVYYVCLTLGFKGKYNIYLLEEQLRQIIRQTGERLRAAGRLQPVSLSSHWRADDRPEAPAAGGLPTWAKVGLPALVSLALLVYVVLYLLLQRELTIVR
ncbi:MAG: DotU family type IV/VI secretion system protein [Pyrinomonadaceae bacterium]